MIFTLESSLNDSFFTILSIKTCLYEQTFSQFLMIETILNSPGKKKSGLKSIYTTRKWRSLLSLTQRGNSSIHYITQVTDNETDPPVMV